MTQAPTGSQYTITLGEQSITVTEVGATLRCYTVDGRDVVSTFAEDTLPFGCQGQQLMPWPNRIRDGHWLLDGEHHQLPVNEPERGNAIHGLVFDKPFTVVAQDDTSLTQRLLLEPTQGWPGTLELVVRHTLSEGGLGVEVTARNLGQARVPFGYAAHPYLVSPDGTPLDECSLVLPFEDYLESDDRLLPVARHAVSGTRFDRRTPEPLAGLELDTAFTAPSVEDGLWQVRLAGERLATVLWAHEAMGWLQVYTPASRDSVAVEPMTCGPDAFNEGPTHQDLTWLAPGEALGVSWGLRREAA